jgi:hypothetical protein
VRGDRQRQRTAGAHTSPSIDTNVAGLGPADLLAAEPALRNLDVPTLIVWGTGDAFFDLKWAYWLRGLIPSAREVVEIAGAKLFFPHERAGDFAAHLRRHWDAPGHFRGSDIDSKPTDLIDGLCDALDEYDACATDLSALVRDADTVIVWLGRLSAPTSIAQLRDEWKALATVLNETNQSAGGPLTGAQRDRVAAGTRELRRLLTGPQEQDSDHQLDTIGETSAHAG